MAWRFYVYALTNPSGAVAYVGKGSGARLAVQRRKHGLAGHEVARFRREKDAYAFERALIADYRPALNKHPGGNGSLATRRRCTYALATSRGEVARFLLSRFRVRLASKVEQLRQVAYGEG